MFNVFVVVIWLCFYHAQACLSVYFVSLLRSSLHLIANSLFLGMFWQFHAAKSKFILFFLHVYSLYVFFFYFCPNTQHNNADTRLCGISFQGCHSNTPQSGWLRPTEIVSQFWRSEVQNQGVDRVVLPLKALGKDLFQPSILASGTLGCSLSCSYLAPILHLCVAFSLCFHTIFPLCMSVSLSKCPPFIRI